MESPRLHGRFVWYDCMSRDVDASIAFYTNVAGWATAPFEIPGMPPYTMWMAGEAPIGGVVPIGEGEVTPPHWLLYIGADDVDKTAEDIKSNGGSVMYGPEDIPTVGRFAICQDPQGAVFAVFTPLEDSPGGPPSPGFMSWHELGSTDSVAGLEFYRAVFGWGDAGTHEMPDDMGNYYMFDAGAWPTGGAYTMPPAMEGMPSYWMAYIMVDDINAACERVKAGGGQLMMEPMEVPGGSRVCVCADPSGAAFGLHEAGPEGA